MAQRVFFIANNVGYICKKANICYSSPMAYYKDKLIKLVHKESGETLFTRKNKKSVQRKMELTKFSKKLKKRVTFKESKK